MVRVIFIAVFVLSMAAGVASYADIYKYVDDSGVIHFTNTSSGEGYKKIISESKKRHISKGTSNPEDFHHIIASKSEKYSVEPSLVMAVIKAESNGDSRAVSRKGAMGLMQLMPYTARDMDVRNPFDPEENIEGGTRYLKYLLDLFDGNLTLALAAYNAGPNAIKKLGYVPPIPETRQYVEKVLYLYNGKKSAGSSVKKQEIVYKVVYEDGTVLYTNTPFAYPNLSQF